MSSNSYIITDKYLRSRLNFWVQAAFLALAVALVFAFIIIFCGMPVLHDLVPYYLAGFGVVQGHGSKVYDPQFLYTLAPVAGLPDASADVFIYPPPFLLLAAPFALLPYNLIQIIWTWMSFACFLFSLYLLARNLPVRFTWQAAGGYWLGMAILAFPVLYTLFLGQVNMIILLLLVACYVLQRKNQTIAAGIALGSLLVLKPLAIPVVLYFLMQRQWRVLVTCMLTGLAWLAASSLVLGYASTIDFLQTFLAWSVHPRGSSNNIAPMALYARLFTPVYPGLPPLLDNPLLARIAATLTTLLLTGILLYLLRKPGDKDLHFALVVTAIPLYSTVTWNHHLVVLFIPAFILLHKYQQQVQALKPFQGFFLAIYLYLVLPGLYVNPVPPSSSSLILSSLTTGMLIALFAGTVMAVRNSRCIIHRTPEQS